MTNPASPAPEVAVRKLVLSVEEVWHDNGPPLATPLLRGSAAAVLKNPYAGRYVADIMPMMEALKPLGREMAARLVAALGGAGRIEAYGKGALVGLAGELEHGALWHVPGGYGMRDLLEGSHAIVPSTTKIGAGRHGDRRADPPPRRRLRAQPFRFARGARRRLAAARRADAGDRHDHRSAAARPGRRTCGQTRLRSSTGSVRVGRRTGAWHAECMGDRRDPQRLGGPP